MTEMFQPEEHPFFTGIRATGFQANDWPPLEPPNLWERAQLVRSMYLDKPGGPTVARLREEAESDPAALLLAVSVDLPFRVGRWLSHPAPTYLVLAAVVLAAR